MSVKHNINHQKMTSTDTTGLQSEKKSMEKVNENVGLHHQDIVESIVNFKEDKNENMEKKYAIVRHELSEANDKFEKLEIELGVKLLVFRYFSHESREFVSFFTFKGKVQNHIKYLEEREKASRKRDS